MKQFPLQCAMRLRHLTMLLVMLLTAIGTANALESDDINAKILSSESTVIPTWEAENWVFSNDSTYLRTPSLENTVSTLTMKFSSEKDVDLNFDYYDYNSDKLALVIDGVETSINYDSYYYDNNFGHSFYHFRKKIGSGNHTIHLIKNAKYSSSYANLKNIALIEYRPLETTLLTVESMPLTFENDPDCPWLTHDGYIQSMNYYTRDSQSDISTTFTIDKPTLFSFEYANGYNGSNNYLYVYINDVLYKSSYSNSWNSEAVVLYPGTHTIKFRNSHSSYDSKYYSLLRNVRLIQDWMEVNLSQPGELAVRVLQALGDKNLQDAELVTISGSLNDDDWSTIMQLTGAKGLDMTKTNITTVPANAFSSNTKLSTVMLPNTVKEIGNSAFVGTNSYQITIPNSVEKIGAEAWRKTPLRYINFEENSNLTHLGYASFAETNILEFDMPNTVTHISRLQYPNSYTDEFNWTYSSSHNNYYYEWALLYGSTSLQKLHLSDGLSGVPAYTAYNCTSLLEVHLPQNAKKIEFDAFYNTTNLKSIDLPESLEFIDHCAFYNSALESIIIPKNVSYLGSYVFQGCTGLKDATLNSYTWDMDYTFYGCTALERLVIPCATPPSIVNNPFYNVDRSKVTLVVPDFALPSYRIDSYWYNFTKAVASDEASVSDYWAIRGNLVLDTEHVMQGTPSININTGGSLTMDTDVSQSFNDFAYNNQESSPASYLSKSNNVTAESLKTAFYVETANKWFFFSPVCDVKMSDVTYPATDSWVIRYYDGERRGSQNLNSGNWINVPSDSILHKGQGYIIQANAAGWLNMPVEKDKHDQFFNEAEVTMQLADNASEAEANAGWNFVANPYPSYYDIYHIDMQAPITVWTGSTYRAYSLNDGDRGDDTFVLRPMQPFFVQKAEADLVTRMPLVGRQVNTVIDRTKAPRRENPETNPLRSLLNLELVKDGADEADDYTRIVINDEASLKYERKRDASKFMSLDAEVAQFFSLGENNTPMAINERPYGSGNVALGVYFPKSGETFTITATRSDRQAWIYDAETGIEQDLTEADYMFTVSKAGYDYNRFSIRFAPGASAVEKVNNVKAKVAGGNGNITVTAAEDANVAVYGADGRVVATCTGSNDFSVAAGVYVVKVANQSFKTIVK